MSQQGKKRRLEETTTEARPISIGSGRCVSVADRYEKLGRVGEGTYGVVYKAKDRKTQKLVALKRCIPHHESSDGFPVTTLREIQTLRICAAHPNVVHLERVAVSSNGVFLVFEYCEHDLADLIDAHYVKFQKSPFTEAATKRLFLQLLSALVFLHQHSILHRDLKLSNLLYSTQQGSLKLADFGLSRSYAASHVALTPNVASLWYRPPELLLGAVEYGPPLDLWAAGCIFAELLQGRPLFNGKTEMAQISQIFRGLGPPRDWPDFDTLPLVRGGSISLPQSKTNTWLLDQLEPLSVAGLRLLTNLLQYNPEKRLSALQARASPYFDEQPLPLEVDRMPRFRGQHLKT